jgi:hypothetical protein
MNVFLLALVLIGLFLATVIALAARAGGRTRLMRRAMGGGGGAALAYVVALVVVNAASAPRVLAPGEREAFCGAYLDCHVGLSVESAAPARVGGRDVRVVTLSLSSDARRATLTPPPLAIRIEDADGRAYRRDSAAELALGLQPDLDHPLPAGASRTTRVAFTVPREAQVLHLRARVHDPLQRLVEGLLIGDPDGLLHAPVLHAVHT